MPLDQYHALSGRSSAVSLAGVKVTADSALKVAAYKRGVELIANYCGKTPYHIKRNNSKEKQHPAWQLVRKWAQYHQLSTFDFARTLVVHALTRGNGYGWIKRDQNYTPVSLHILDPGRVEPALLAGKLIYRITGIDKTLSAVDVIHIKSMTTDGYVGLDPIKTYAVDVLGLSLAQQLYASSYYASGGSPGLYLHSELPIDDDHFNRLKGETGPLKRSVENPHEIPIIDGAELKALQLSAEQTQLLGAREFSLKDIANCLGMSVHKLQGDGKSSYKSLEEENRAFRDDTLDPWFVQFEIQFEKLLTEDEQTSGEWQVEAVRESLTRTNMTDRANYLKTAVGGPWMTPAEARDVDSLEFMSGTNKLLAPLNMVPVDGQQKSQGRSDTLLQLAAVEDVIGRMQRRLTVGIRKANSADTLRSALDAIDEKHLPVIRAALVPVIQLCGGSEDHATAAARMITETIRSQLADVPAEHVPEFIATRCDAFELTTPIISRKAAALWLNS